MLERTSRHALPLLGRTADVAPAAQACCGLCRSCMTTNLVGLLAAGCTAAAVVLARLAGRIVKRSSLQ
jgi:hypothetical protein